MSRIQYVIDDKNIVTGVIVPIDLWRKIRAQNKKVRMMKSKRKKREAEIGRTDSTDSTDLDFFKGIDKI
jgi:hypothetical protein